MWRCGLLFACVSIGLCGDAACCLCAFRTAPHLYGNPLVCLYGDIIICYICLCGNIFIYLYLFIWQYPWFMAIPRRVMGARERGSGGAGERMWRDTTACYGSEGARERGSEGAKERGSEGANVARYHGVVFLRWFVGVHSDTSRFSCCVRFLICLCGCIAPFPFIF
jgi:hypothetical protein